MANVNMAALSRDDLEVLHTMVHDSRERPERARTGDTPDKRRIHDLLREDMTNFARNNPAPAGDPAGDVAESDGEAVATTVTCPTCGTEVPVSVAALAAATR
jgi:hypothetical protein